MDMTKMNNFNTYPPPRKLAPAKLVGTAGGANFRGNTQSNANLCEYLQKTSKIKYIQGPPGHLYDFGPGGAADFGLGRVRFRPAVVIGPPRAGNFLR